MTLHFPPSATLQAPKKVSAPPPGPFFAKRPPTEAALLLAIECRDLPAFLPQLHGVAVNEPLGKPDGFTIVGREDRDAVSDVAVVANEVGVVADHFCAAVLTLAVATRETAANR
jgi:hypothetical protein